MPKERINEQITANKVRLIGADGKQIGIVSLKEALHRAEAEDLDLVEISPNADPPVCRIMDFSKYYFEKEKKAKEARKRQHEVEIKEIKLGPNTEEHDYNFKKNNAIKFLKQHNKVKFTIRFRGRQMAHQELGLNVLERIKADLGHIAEPETEPVAERNMLYIIMSPKKDIDRILAKMEKEKTALEGKTVPTTQDKANSSTPAEPKKENLK
ncbi:MAG: translation initiation factor IF-3 [Candidatus Cloacimonetes bacterium]|uniref:Translation initiation factor IF-3 n=1 Tax=Candidatus Syntrophosphaera thermopropionivorans TaxID=2593015 RepID=A0AC61QKB5_9BACT|nr:translation initiation factor IF-3 [Candidatus Cloacimonadota bacterium]TDF74133.1 translation initiation factor IF-3 [Candidatus Syntrophosphaera thermopropionivorans]HNU97821.1 translation initiation factor IF-3 [Candidatus Syntrophosphaera thermopropionivorans]HOQ82772.1 translation initiation factor IF-3 [Candidatus Syntrophosphaera thermopropionivorans]HPW24240.1 translation initiation factor IF-3 [Candidatus Syntrophosphaera thermopropionivorans]